MENQNDRARESHLRRLAHSLSWRVEKSRARILHGNNHGLYQVIDDRNTVREGSSYDASLDHVERCLVAERDRIAG